MAGTTQPDNQLARYEFKRQLEDLRECRGRATELISLYVPPGRQISDVVAYLRNEYAQSSNIKSRTTRKNVMWAIDSLMGRLRAYKEPPKNGVVFFVGNKAISGDQTEPVTFVIEPPEQINTYLYRCDSSFFLEPLEGMLAEKETYGLIVIDRKEVTIGLLKGKRIVVIRNKESQVPSKHGRGGQSQHRFERLIEQAAHDFYKRSAEIANDAFLNEKDLKGVLVGGPGATKEYFIKEGYLHHELMKKIIEPFFDTGYTDEYGLREIVEKASGTLSDLAIMKEKKLIQRLMSEIRKADIGLAAYGEQQVRHALEVGAVDILLLSEALRKDKYTVKCQNCDYSRVETAKEEPKNLGSCPKCQSILSIASKVDIVDEYYKMAEDAGTSVQIISGESEEGELLLRAFGGIAAILRFPLGAQ